ncbi:ABC transporter substrate-binding protein [Kribbella sp. NPDC055110]
MSHQPVTSLSRRGFLLLSGGAVLGTTALSACASADANGASEALAGALPTGAPKSGTTLKIAGSSTQLQLKAAGPAIKPLDFTVGEWVNASGGPEVIQAFRANAVDVASNALIPPIQAHDINLDTKVVAVAEKPKPTYVFATAPGTDIKDFSQFKGKKIAFSQGQAQGVVVLRTLDTAGIRYDEVKLVALPSSAFLTALQSKQVDIAPLSEPSVTKYVGQYERDGARAIRAEEVDLLSILWTPTKNLADEDKVRAIQDYIRVWAQGQVWAWENAEKWKKFYYVDDQGVSPADADRIWKYTNKPLFPKKWDDAAVWGQKTIDLIAEGGFIKKFDVKELFDSRFEGLAATFVDAQYTK